MSYLNSDPNSHYYGHCVESPYSYTNDNGDNYVTYYLSSTNEQKYLLNGNISLFKNGYTYNPDDLSCTIVSSDSSDAEYLGLMETDYNMLMGITANLIGFTLIFMIGLLISLQGKK